MTRLAYQNILTSTRQKLAEIRQDTLQFAIVCVAVTTISGWGVYKGYGNYRAYIERSAQRAFSGCLEEYFKVENPATAVQAALFCSMSYAQQYNTAFAPYCLATQAQATAMQGDVPQAVSLMEKAIKGMDNSPLKGFYQLTQALMGIDYSEQAVHDRSVEQLRALSADVNNLQRDVALYYLGYYYFTHNDLVLAKNTWQQLADTFTFDDQHKSSPWIKLARQKLESLT